MLTIRDLEYFVAIVELKHFGRASEATKVSQPTLSMQFKKLEQRLGGRLIERLPRGVKLTPLGKEILPLAHRILELVSDIETRCGATERQPRLRLGIIPTIAPYLLPKMTRDFAKQFKGQRISIHEAQTADLVQQVKEGSLDCAILSTPLEDRGLKEVTIFSEPFYLAVSKSHALARRKKVRLEDIHKEKLLLLGEGHCLRYQALSLCKISNSNHDADLSSTSIETLRSMVAMQAGITLIPQMAIRKDKSICYIPFVESSAQRSIGVICRPTFNGEALIQSIIQIVKAAA